MPLSGSQQVVHSGMAEPLQGVVSDPSVLCEHSGTLSANI